MSMVNAITQRKAIERVRSYAKSLDLNPAAVRPQTLHLFAKLDPTVAAYEFEISDSKQLVCPIEVRLKDSSLFCANLFALSILKAPIAASVEYPAGAPLLSYPDKGIFNIAAGTAALSESQALEMPYHGQLSMTTDQLVRLDRVSCEIFRYAPETQNAATTHPSQALNLVDLASSFFIWGDRKNTLSLRLPDGGDRTHIKGGAASQNYLVISIGGFEVVNAANSKRVQDVQNRPVYF